jgi:hypothetical protein
MCCGSWDANTVDKICEKYAWNNFELLMIDTEGYDYEILKSINLKKYTPRVISFEHVHLSFNEREAAIKLLVSNDYKINIDSMDVTASK